MCVFNVWTLYVESHVWGHDEVRTKHVMSNGVTPLVGPKSQSATQYFLPNAQHFVTFRGATATDNQSSSLYVFSRATIQPKS